jgi:protein involved in sex pheromone biosynthesis
MYKLLALSAAAMIGLLSGCSDDADVASRNISKAADNFEINRRIVFYNGITGDYMLTIEGLCSQQPSDRKLAVTCKTGPNQFKKHFLGLSDNVTYFSEQVESAKASVHFYRVTFKPSVIIPDIEVR